MNLVPYQLDPALQALRQPRQRILIADAVGLGKTLEAGILTTELIQRGRGQRILVITLKSMLTQFQKEFWSRFSIPLVRLDSVGLQRVRNSIPSNHNPFNFYDRTIISIDTLKNNLEYRNYLENAWWDIIIIDECHNVAARGNEDGMSRRARLARMLSGRSDTMMLLSATPHDGSARSFASLMSLLDPTAISDPDDYTPEDFRDKGPRSAVIWAASTPPPGILDQSGPAVALRRGGTSPHLPPYPRAVPAAAPLAPPVLAAASASFALRLIYRITATTLGRSILWRDRSNCFAQRNLPHIPQSPRVLKVSSGGWRLLCE